MYEKAIKKTQIKSMETSLQYSDGYCIRLVWYSDPRCITCGYKSLAATWRDIIFIVFVFSWRISDDKTKNERCSDFGVKPFIKLNLSNTTDQLMYSLQINQSHNQ